MPKPDWMSDATWDTLQRMPIRRDSLFTTTEARPPQEGVRAIDVRIQLQALKALMGDAPPPIRVSPLVPAFDEDGNAIAYELNGVTYVSPIHAHLVQGA